MSDQSQGRIAQGAAIRQLEAKVALLEALVMFLMEKEEALEVLRRLESAGPDSVWAQVASDLRKAQGSADALRKKLRYPDLQGA